MLVLVEYRNQPAGKRKVIRGKKNQGKKEKQNQAARREKKSKNQTLRKRK